MQSVYTCVRKRAQLSVYLYTNSFPQITHPTCCPKYIYSINSLSAKQWYGLECDMYWWAGVIVDVHPNWMAFSFLEQCIIINCYLKLCFYFFSPLFVSQCSWSFTASFQRLLTAWHFFRADFLKVTTMDHVCWNRNLSPMEAYSIWVCAGACTYF